MITYVVALALLTGGFLWGAVEYRRRGRRWPVIGSIAIACVSMTAIVAVIHALQQADNFWTWAGIPMARRYTMRGC
jgi:hypothetical protein